MAEILGVVAGGAGLAQVSVQLISNCDKMRVLYKSYKDAPNFLADTLDEMKTLALMLRRIEEDRQRRGSNRVSDGSVAQFVRKCQGATAQVQGVVDELERMMQKSSVRGRLFTVLRREHIRSLYDDLEKAKASLLVALGFYTISCQSEDTSRIIERLDRNDAVLRQHLPAVAVELTPLPRPHSDAGLTSQDEPPERVNMKPTRQLGRPIQRRGKKTFYKDSSRQTQRWKIRLRPWFTRQVWDISLNASQAGFNINLRTCNFVPNDSLIFEACARGDLAEVQTLFRRGQASPFDCSYDCSYDYHYGDHKSVLSEAARSCNSQLCRYLVDVAGFPVRPNQFADPIEIYSLVLKHNGREPGGTEIYRMLLQDSNLTPLDQTDGGSWWNCCPNSDAARMALAEFPETFATVSWKSRINSAMRASWFAVNIYDLFPAMLGFQGVNPQVAQARDYRGITCLHLVCRMAEKIRLSRDYWPEIVRFVRQLLACGACLHDKNNNGDTPFTALFRPMWPKVNFKSWLQLLKEADINLNDYGRIEHTIWSAALADDIEKHKRIWVTGLTFGPNVEDWVIERRQRQTIIPIFELFSAPGAWPDHTMHMIRKICWHPQLWREDHPEGPCQWEKVGEVAIYDGSKKPPPPLVECPTPMDSYYDLEWGTQDDDRSVTRLLATGYMNPRSRTRSYSQPVNQRPFTSPRVRINKAEHHSWLPCSHICEGGRQRIGYGHGRRSCIKGIHDGLSHVEYYRNDIKREMRHFQTRYTDPEDLPSLPYAAYHPVWTRN